MTVGGRVYPVDDPFKSECQQEFYSLRVDIAGMKTLGDALAGYVRGEMLDGEDKFPLDGGVEVVAEKRVCLAMSQVCLRFCSKSCQFCAHCCHLRMQC